MNIIISIGILFQLVFSLEFQPKQLLYSSTFDQDLFTDIWDISLRKDHDFESAQTISYGFWLKWSFVGPKLLEKQQEWHSICRLTTRENHTDFQDPQDRALSIWLSHDFYHFSTYTKEYPEKFFNIKYASDQLDGNWNFIYYGYSYRENLARGYIVFANNQIEEALIPAEHQRLKYLRFLIKREFNNPSFNGYYSNIFLQINEDYPTSKENLLSFLKSHQLISSLGFHQIFSQNILINSKIDTSYDKSSIQQFEFKDVDSSEYSISGWLKFTMPLELKDRNLIFRLSHLKVKEGIFDKIFFLYSSFNYTFESYDCQQECSIVNWNIETNNNDNYWHFVYVAYNHELKKIFQFFKFDDRAFTIQKENIHHYQSQGMFLNLQKDEYTPGYNGQMKRWTFNFGQGAYIEENFERDLFLQSKIGIINFEEQPEIQLWQFEQSDLNINFDSDEDLQENEIDPDQSHFDSYEYGYGFWMKFLYNYGTRTQSQTNLTQGVSRFGTAQIYKDRQNLGESTLSVYIKINEIIFETYSSVDKQVKQYEINLESDNQWQYIYTGYKRIYEETGQILGCVYDYRGANTCILQYNNIVHYSIDNFLFFSVGSIGSKRRETQHFSGQIQDIRLYFGKGSILPKFNEIKWEQISQQIWITKQQESFSVDRMDKTPSEFKLEEFVSEYGLELWFKNLGTTDETFQFIFLLASKQDIQPENIYLAAKLNQKQSIILQSHFLDSNLYIQEQLKEIELLHDIDKQQWTYMYFGYRKNKCLYFIQAKTNRFKDSFECKHFASNQFFLYKGYDGRQHNFLGDIDYLKIDFGQGAFKSQFYTQAEAFKQGLKLFPTSFEWKGYFDKIIQIESQKSALQQIFQSNNKISMNGQRNYGYGYWSRFLTEYPKLVKSSNNSSFLSISQLFQNQNQNKDLEILSFYISSDKQQYKIKTYDLETQKYKFGSFQLIKSQEGIWNYVYLSYSSDEKQVVGFIYQQQSNRVIRVIVKQVHHSSLNGKVNFNLGQFQNYEGFNGQIAKLSLHFDGSSYKEDIDSFKKIVEQSKLNEIPAQNKEFQFVSVSQKSEYKQYQVHLEENQFPEEYTIYGWFRPDIESYDIQDSYQDTLLRLSSIQIIEMEIPKFEFQIRLTQNGIETSTYSTEVVNQPSSWVQNIPLNSNLGAWFYVCASYSQKLQRVIFHFKVVDNYESKIFNDILHYLANNYYLYLSDDKDFGFKGQISQIGLQIGQFYSKNEGLPEIQLRSEHQIYQYKNYDGKFESVHRLNIIEGKHELIGQTQYSVSLWARWLHELKEDMDADADQNLLFRFAKDINYEDCSVQGDRIFVVYLIKHAYQFSTYNTLAEECSQQKQIFNTNFLEGQWNLVYFGYQNNQDFVGAKGFVYFSKNSVSNELEFDVEHFPLSATAALTLGQREYSFDRFYGQMHDVQVTIGYGFENDIKSLMRRTTIPDPDLNTFQKHSLINEENLLEKLENTQFMSKLNLEKQYALFGWFKYQGETEFGKYSVLARVSTNQELKGSLSDQTFLVLVNEHTIEFKSYTLESQPQEGEYSNEITKPFDFIGKEQDSWIFFYIGYNFEENTLIVYVKYNDDLHQQQEVFQNVFHYLPLQFYIFIGQDNIYSKFTGQVDDINLLTGQSSYVEQNIYQKLGSLNRKYIEDVLH